MNISLNKKKMAKAIILRKMLIKELIDGSFYEKSELEDDLKGIITKSQLEFHLYSKKKNEEGLISKRIVSSNRGILRLDLKRGNAVAKMIGYLENEPKIGPRVRYFFEKAFIEAFLSNYGDRFWVRLDLYQYLERRSIRTRELLKNGSKYFEEMNIRIGELERLFKEHGSLGITYAADRGKSQEELISILVNFVKTVKGDTDVPFLLGYILNVIEISRLAENTEGEWEKVNKSELFLRQENATKFLMSNKDKKEIRTFPSKASSASLEIFINKVLRKAIKGSPEEENYSAENDNLLSLYSGRIALASFLIKSQIVDNLTIFLAPLEVPSREMINSIISSVPARINDPQTEISEIMKSLEERRSERIKILDAEVESISRILGLEMDILGITEEEVIKSRNGLKETLDQFIEFRKRKENEKSSTFNQA